MFFPIKDWDFIGPYIVFCLFIFDKLYVYHFLTPPVFIGFWELCLEMGEGREGGGRVGEVMIKFLG